MQTPVGEEGKAEKRYSTVILLGPFACGKCGATMLLVWAEGPMPVSMHCCASSCPNSGVDFAVPKMPIESLG